MAASEPTNATDPEPPQAPAADAGSPAHGGRTAWARNWPPGARLPERRDGRAVVMLAATIVALVWANSPWRHSYESLWTTQSPSVGGGGISTDLRHWVDEGLMAFLHGRRARGQARVDLGDCATAAGWRSRCSPRRRDDGAGRDLLALNVGGPERTAGGRRCRPTPRSRSARSPSDPRSAKRLRVFLLTLAVADDLCALLVIGRSTRGTLDVALAIAIALFGVLLALRDAPAGRRPVTIAVAVGMWVAMFKSGVDR